LVDYLFNPHDTLTKKQNRMATMIDTSPNKLPAPYLYLDDRLHLCGAHVPTALLRSLHE
jgi:hypothetical protein